MLGDQQPIKTLDLSFLLRTIMAARDLTVNEMAKMAGVSKSAMEKYLAGPSSPRATVIASLSKALGLSADTIMFGALDPDLERAYQLAFQAFASLIEDLKLNEILAMSFGELTPGTEAFAEFVRNTAFDRAGSFKRAFNAKQRDGLFVSIG